MTSEYRKPVPRPTLNPEVSAPFWAGTKKHELWLQYCKRHGGFFFYPREACPTCWGHGDEIIWSRASGMGRVHSFTTVYQPASPMFHDTMPMAQVLIELDEGVRMVGNMADVTSEDYREDPALLKISQRVEAVFEDVTPEWTLIRWRRVDEALTPGSESVEPNKWLNDPRFNWSPQRDDTSRRYNNVSFRGQAAIIGIGELPTQRSTPGSSVGGLMAQVSRLAIEDAHITKDDIDGIITEGGETFPGFVAEYMGIRPRFGTGSSMMGASGATGVTLASMAVMNGLANYVLVVIAQARNPALGGGAEGFPGPGGEFDFPYGPAAGANTGYAQIYKRHMDRYGTTQDQLANVAANERANAQGSDNAVFNGQPITHADVLASRYVNYPLRLLECVMPCGGAAAVIVTTTERAKASLTKPAYVLGGGIALDDFGGMQRPDITVTPVARSAPIALSMSGYSPRDIQFAEFYDWYTILHALCLEDAGIVPKGEIGPFFASTDTTYGGSFPINTDGGQLSGGQPGLAGGFRHVVEAARQIMGKAGVRQIERNDLGLVNGWGGTASSMCTLVLGSENSL